MFGNHLARPSGLTRLALGGLLLWSTQSLGCAVDATSDAAAVAQTENPLWVKGSKIWSSGVIQVCWKTSGWPTEKAWVQQAVHDTWEAVPPGVVKFVGWEDCQREWWSGRITNGVPIEIKDDHPHTVGLGTDNAPANLYIDNGMVLNFTYVNFDPGCVTDYGLKLCIQATAAHEFGHLLGFAHEQNRGDTPDLWVPGYASWCKDMVQGNEGDAILTAWDRDSIMNYCSTEWNNLGRLSDGDKRGLLTAYGGKNAGTSSAPGQQFQADLNGDGYEDAFALYDYGGDKMGVWVWSGSMNGLTPPWNAFLSAPGDWRWGNAKPLAGDFDGDGKADIAAFYNYGNDNSAIWVWYSTGSGFLAPQLLWYSGVTNWSWERSQPVVGDFNGDGVTDIAVFYDYGSDDTALFSFDFRRGRTVDAPVQRWRSGAGNWRASNIKPVTGHFVAGEGRLTDIMVFYDYGSSDTGSFLFRGLPWGIGAPTPKWRSGPGNWAWSNSKFVAADFNGNGLTDIACLYDYGSSDAALWLFWEGNGWPSQVWRSGAGNWYQPGTSLAAGRFAGGTRAQIAGFYDYGSDTSAIWTFRGPLAGWAPVAQWYSGHWNWSAPRTKFF